MSAPDRRAMVQRPGEDLSVRRQCALLSVARSGSTAPDPSPGRTIPRLSRCVDEDRSPLSPRRVALVGKRRYPPKFVDLNSCGEVHCTIRLKSSAGLSGIQPLAIAKE